MVVRMLVPLMAGLACAPHVAPVAPSMPGVTVSTLPATLRGLSGLTVDDAGRLWAVAERTAALVPLRLDGDRVVPDGDPLPLAGWRADTDAESIAWCGAGVFALGAEPRWAGDRGVDEVVDVMVADGRATVTGAREVTYAPFGVRAEANRGLEGLTCTPTTLLAAAETVVVGATGTRGALLWRLAPGPRAPGLPTDPPVTATLRLTSETGKIADLAARDAGAATHVLAIERHYGVARLVEADITWGTAERPTEATARVVRDLAGVLDPMPNLEGLVWLADGRVVLLADNDNGGRTGPGVAVVIAAP